MDVVAKGAYDKCKKRQPQAAKGVLHVLAQYDLVITRDWLTVPFPMGRKKEREREIGELYPAGHEETFAPCYNRVFV